MAYNYGNYFLILLLLVFFMLLYVYVVRAPPAKKYERFEDKGNKLLPPDKVVYIQGNGIPDTPLVPTRIDTKDPSAQSVDGTPGGPRSMFMFAYNRCSPECCEHSAYSCQGGCACMTDDQLKMASVRGSNNHPNKCGNDENYL